MAWLGWALAAMGFMGLANLGMKAASLRGLEPASVLFWVVVGEVPVALGYWLWRGRPVGSTGGVAWALGVPPARLLLGAWPLVIPYLLATSWAFFMVPLALAGQSPMMGTFGVTLPENTAERRMTFSLVHLLSVVCFPLSFLCMILSPRHQTLAELLSGQELLARPTARMR